MQIPPAVAAHLSKINFASLALASLLFFLPWTNLTCSGREAGTQSGVQTIYAGFSEADWIEEMGPKDGASKRGPAEGEEKSGKDDLGYGLIALLAFAATVGGSVVAGLLLFKNVPPAVSPAGLAAVALVLLLFQCVIGFPIDRAAKRAMKEVDKDMPKTNDPMEREMARSMAAAVNIKTERTGWFYLELLALAVPAGLMIYSMVPDRTAAPGAIAGTTAGAAPVAPPPPPPAPSTGAPPPTEV